MMQEINTIEKHEHKLLSVGDFGPWYCAWCKKGTDETGPLPEEVSCIEDKNDPLYKG